MEQVINHYPAIVRPAGFSTQTEQTDSNTKAFIEANTIEVGFTSIRDEHIIPVFVKDNEPLISHSDFIHATLDLTADIFHGEQIMKPAVRVSHPIKGRIPDAKDKPAHLLNDWEKTIYYERMMFVIEIPSIHDEIDGNRLSLTIGGVKAYNQDNLYSRNQCDQHFKLFIGFQNKVCTNLCVWTDGYFSDIKVRTIGQLKSAIRMLLESYNKNYHLSHLKSLTNCSITEQQFAQLVGRCRMYNHLPSDLKAEIPALLFGDQQLATVVKDFYKDESFCKDRDGNINLWRLYNLFTGANKSTYIDNFLDRSVNAFNFVEQVRHGLEGRADCWYLQ
jgi:hypothetical protein